MRGAWWLVLVACAGDKGDDTGTGTGGSCDLSCDWVAVDGDGTCGLVLYCDDGTYAATCYGSDCSCGYPSEGATSFPEGGFCDLSASDRACEAVAQCEGSWSPASPLTGGGGAEVTPPATGCVAGGLTLEPATGVDDSTFAPLVAGDPVVMVHGPQGGWHIDFAGTVGNSSEIVSIDATFTNVATGAIVAGLGQQPARLALTPIAGAGSPWACEGRYYGVRVFVDDIATTVTQDDICDLEGATLQLDAVITSLEDPQTPPVILSTTVTAALDPIDIPACQ